MPGSIQFQEVSVLRRSHFHNGSLICRQTSVPGGHSFRQISVPERSMLNGPCDKRNQSLACSQMVVVNQNEKE